ncbi:RNA-binding protein [Halomonas saccharevitans]|uniref:RNA-binding protein n=2 Tax=Halomonas saccharevitans TaxID=416872 RepID=A0A1I6YL34_9GAMM|nr:RNA-binding protein [Halomonas saccharevitans]
MEKQATGNELSPRDDSPYHVRCAPTGKKQDTMSLSQAQKKAFRSIGHHLDPVVTVSENGASEGVLAELDRALRDHELVKVKLALPDRDDRAAMLDELVTASGAEPVQKIGKMALLYRHNPKVNPKLSNITRFEEHHGRR